MNGQKEPEELFDAPPPVSEADYGKHPTAPSDFNEAAVGLDESTTATEPRLTLDPGNPLPSARAPRRDTTPRQSGSSKQESEQLPARSEASSTTATLPKSTPLRSRWLDQRPS